MRVSVVIPTHDRPECLGRLVATLLAQTHRVDEIIFVNDGCEPVDAALVRRVEAGGIDCRVIRRTEPSSAASRNAGLAEAGGDIVMCIDDDMILPAGLLGELVELYRLDARGIVAGIGVPYEETRYTWKWRLWQAFAAATGRLAKWAPRRQASRYARLNPELAGRLAPARMIAAGALSLRGRVARWARFDESMSGYALGEDREFSYRIGREQPLFVASLLRIGHDPPEGGRGDWRTRGRVYVRNVLHIAGRSTDGGAGTVLLVAMDFAGAMVQYTLWAVVTRRRDNFDFALGMGAELCRQGAGAIRKMLCGC